MFRAHAVVQFMGITLLRRTDVGAAVVRLEDSADQMRLVFAAGSRPSRAGGIRRAGYMEETVQVSNPLQIEFFGLMSASKEESLAEARTSLAHSGAEPTRFTAIRGTIRQQKLATQLKTVALEQPASWDNCLETVERCRRQLGAENLTEITAPVANPVTFLYAIWSTLNSGQPACRRDFVHNGKAYTLTAKVAPDAKRGSEFAKRNMVNQADGVHVLHGRIEPHNGAGGSDFRVWFDQSGAKPRVLQFDFQARSFLRLSFEAAGHEAPVSGS
jgi:hypothetical protein